MLTDEQITALIQELSGEIDQLDEGPDKRLTGKERSRKRLLHLRREALKKIQTVRQKGSLLQEVRAIMDYDLLTQYGNRPFLLNFIKARFTHFGL